MHKNAIWRCILRGLSGRSEAYDVRLANLSHRGLFALHLLMNVVIACGGTGGHLFPGLAVAERLRERGHQLLIFISEKEIDALAVRDHVNAYRFERLPSVGMPRSLSSAVFRFARGFAVSVARCRSLYREFKPDAVLGMGGFTSTAPILMGRRMGLPTFIHESNAIPGKANRLNARLARVVLLGFKDCAKYFPARVRCIVTGTPIRASLRSKLEASHAKQLFGLEPASTKLTVLIMGGSQGAHGLNRAILAALPVWKDLVQVIHLTGKSDEAVMREAYAREGIAAYVAAFHHRMQEVYSAADLAIARSGAASLSELAHFGLPCLLIPFPAAAEDHQTLNARLFSEAGAAVLLPEGDLAGGRLAAAVNALSSDRKKLGEMAVASQLAAPADAASSVVETLEEQCKK